MAIGVVRGDATGFTQEIEAGRLLEIANRCPVHRTLVSEIDIRTRLA